MPGSQTLETIQTPLCTQVFILIKNPFFIAFQWDSNVTSTNLDLNPENERICTSRTSLHSFKTTYGNVALAPGFRYYFAIRIINGNNFKIGVSQTRNALDSAFSDTQDGWAYYSGGSLRHGSKAEGTKYGEAFQASDIIGTYIDLVDVIFLSGNSSCIGTDILFKER